MDINEKRGIKKLLKISLAVFIIVLVYSGISYPMGIPVPDLGAISAQIESVETSAGSAFSSLESLAGTLGYAPGASGGPLFNPGPGLSEAMATADKLGADISKMREEYQNIIINFDKLAYITQSVSNAEENIASLNKSVNNAFNQIPQELTGGDASGFSTSGVIAGIRSYNAMLGNIENKGASAVYNPGNFFTGNGSNLTRENLENGSSSFLNSAVFNSLGNTGSIKPKFGCPGYDGGYLMDNSGNFVSGCGDFVDGFSNDAASTNLFNAGISAARAHKAELEGDAFMGEITGSAIPGSSDYYSYSSSILTIIAEENAISIKNMGYMESQLKQLEISNSAREIEKNHIGPVILGNKSTEQGINFYNKTTL